MCVCAYNAGACQLAAGGEWGTIMIQVDTAAGVCAAACVRVMSTRHSDVALAGVHTCVHVGMCDLLLGFDVWNGLLSGFVNVRLGRSRLIVHPTSLLVFI